VGFSRKQSEMLNNNCIYEVWKARKNVVIPTGTVAYHLQSQRQYSAGSKLKVSDRRGDLLVCRKQFTLQLKEVPVTLRRGDSGPCVHLVWCSLDLEVTNIGDIAIWSISEEKSSLSFSELGEKLKLVCTEALRAFEKYDLTTEQGQKEFESQAHTHITVMLGLQVQRCTLRRILTEHDYMEEKKCWVGFELKLRHLANDRLIGEAAEQKRLEQTLTSYENETILALLTDQEKKLAALKRLSKYVELLSPPQGMTSLHTSDPCPYIGCRLDLSAGQTFNCGYCKNKLHAWHRSLKNTELCEHCHELIWKRRKQWAAVAIIIVAIGGIVLGLQNYTERLRKDYEKKSIDPLTIYWYGFGERYEDGAWREFKVKDGMTMYDGDQFRVAFVPNADSYVYVLCINSDGRISQLFPNPAIRQGNFCRRGQEYQIPDGINWFRLDEEVGTETLFLVASYDPMTDLGEKLKQAAGEISTKNASVAVKEMITGIEQGNKPDANGQIRTRSGIIVRGIDIKPSKRLVSVKLESGEQVERAMEFIQGKASVVHRVQFSHISRGLSNL